MLQHFKQKTDITCGSACLRILLSDTKLISEKEACDLAKTKKSGTSIYNVKKALDDLNIESNLIHLDTDWKTYFHWLDLNSKNRKIYLSCKYQDYADGGYKTRGRPRIRNHACVISNGMVYDPAEKKVIPIECYNSIWNKSMKIRAGIFIDI